MTEAAKVLEIKKKSASIKIELIEPQHIIDIWRMVEKSHKEAAVTYPSLEETPPEDLRAHLFNTISAPNFIGFVAKQGRKPVGMILGAVFKRPVGKPDKALNMIDLFVEPEFRKRGILKALMVKEFAAAKAMGVHYWEASITDDKILDLVTKFHGAKIQTRVGGKTL